MLVLYSHTSCFLMVSSVLGLWRKFCARLSSLSCWFLPRQTDIYSAEPQNVVWWKEAPHLGGRCTEMSFSRIISACCPANHHSILILIHHHSPRPVIALCTPHFVPIVAFNLGTSPSIQRFAGRTVRTCSRKKTSVAWVHERTIPT
jgi:hypothetical protein